MKQNYKNTSIFLLFRRLILYRFPNAIKENAFGNPAEPDDFLASAKKPRVRISNFRGNSISYERLERALENRDLKGAFEAAHALKGVYGNLALEPLYRPMSEMTEHLRCEEDIDYAPYMEKISAKRKELIEIIA